MVEKIKIKCKCFYCMYANEATNNTQTLIYERNEWNRIQNIMYDKKKTK